jgi:hypothetical protein
MLVVAVLLVPEMGDILADFRERCLAPIEGFGARTWRFLSVGHRTRVVQRHALRAYRRSDASARAGAP